MSNKNLKAISLFSGIGGLEIAFQSVFGDKSELLSVVEADFHRSQVLKKLGAKHTIISNIEKYSPSYRFRGEEGIVFGGFPCKGTSSAGNRDGLENEQSQLFFEMLRVIKEVHPAYVIIENPTGLLQRGLKDVLNGLRSAGYCEDLPQIVSAAEVGAAHKRERVFIVAYANRLVEAKGGILPKPWADSIGQQIEKVRQRKGLSYQPSVPRVPNGISSESYDHWNRLLNREGWWQQETCPPWFIKKGKDKSRYARASALGDACTPQQAEVPFLRVKELVEFFEVENELVN